MTKLVARIRNVLSKEPFALHLFQLGLLLNVWAWVIPRGHLRQAGRDPFQIAGHVSSWFVDIGALQTFWNAVLFLTLLSMSYSAYKIVWFCSAYLRDRVDL